MRRYLLLLSVLMPLGAVAQPHPGESQLQHGDLVFQSSRSSQSMAIQKATGSPYSHVGLLEVDVDGVFVIEAVQPVSRTPWSKWKQRGVGGKVTVMRMQHTPASDRARAVALAKRWLGKRYDFAFDWTDEALYCSELVHKAYLRAAGVQVGQLQSLGSLDLGPVQAELRARFGPKLPLERRLVTPASMAADPQLAVVFSDY